MKESCLQTHGLGPRVSSDSPWGLHSKPRSPESQTRFEEPFFQFLFEEVNWAYSQYGWDFLDEFQKIPERPRKRSQNLSWNSPREYGWDPPTYDSGHLKASEHFQNSCPPQYGWGLLEPAMEFPAVLGAFLSIVHSFLAGRIFLTACS